MKNMKVENLGTNQEVFTGFTVKVGEKFYIISKSPFNYEVMIFQCDKNGQPTSHREVWNGKTFAEAEEFLKDNQP